MALHVADKEITGVFFSDKTIVEIYYAEYLMWIIGNLFTSDGDVLLTSDGEVLEVED